MDLSGPFAMTRMTRRFGLLVAVPLTAVHVTFLPPLRRSSSVARPVFGRKASAKSSGAAAPTGSRRSLSGRYKEKLKPLEETAGFVDTHCHLDKVIPRLSRQSHEDWSLVMEGTRGNALSFNQLMEVQHILNMFKLNMLPFKCLGLIGSPVMYMFTVMGL